MSRFSYIKQTLFSALRKRVLGPFAQGVMYRTSNGLLAAPLEDVSVGKALGFKGGYDTGEINELQKLVNPDDTIYVVGTHIGALLIPLAAKCKVLVGYEANPDTYEYVRINAYLNGTRNVTLYNLAVGDSARKIEFYQNRSNSGGSKIKPLTDQYFYTYDSPKTIEVPMISLDEHIRSEQLPVPDGIVMDIEGAEFLALKGMQETLAKTRFLYIEFVPHHLENVSGATNDQFFALLLPHFSHVRFMRTHPGTIDVRSNPKEFQTVIDEYRKQGQSDDLLFIKNGDT